MAHERESFPTLADGSGVGAVLAQRVEGDSSAAKNGAIGFAFKDSSGNVILPQLNSLGQLPVTLDATTTADNLYATGLHAGSTSLQILATITLTASAKYTDIEMLVSSFQDSEFTVVWNNNGTPTTLMQALVGSGQYTFKDKMSIDFTAGATGTQELLLKAKNMRNPVSQLTGTITVKEL